MSKRILIVGCGQLGSRHLQAVALLPKLRRISIVDPNPASLQLGKQRFAEIKGIDPKLELEWLKNLDDVRGPVDLCILSTLSVGRLELIRDIFQKTGTCQFLIEKIVCQSIQEYKEIMAFAKTNQLKIWVNCKTRAYQIHQYFKSKIDPQGPVIMSVIGGNHGLATNGIHDADLFLFYDGSSRIEQGACSIDPMVHPSKRGECFFELSGTVTGATSKGSRIQMTFAQGHLSPDSMEILTPTARLMIDHMQQFAMESYQHEGWQWKPIAVKENWQVSAMTTAFAREILNEGACLLPTLKECWGAHEFILSALNPYFNQLLKSKIDSCPVT